MRVGHASNASSGSKQLDINAPRFRHYLRAVIRPKTKADRRQLLVQAKRVIGRRYAEFDLGLADIADDLGCSTRQLQRIFREADGTTVRDYLLSVRMKRARQLLSQGQTVRQAARAAGYREASGLRQQFVPYFGANPSDFQPAQPDYDEFWRAAEESDN